MPARRHLITLAVLAVVAGAAVWVFGLGVAQSIMVAVALVAVGVTWLAVRDGDPGVWPVPERRRTLGARKEVQSLSWSMKSRGGVHSNTVARLRQSARHLLYARFGLDLLRESDRPAIERYLAPSVVAILLSPSGTNLPLATFTRCLTALEALDTPPKGVQ